MSDKLPNEKTFRLVDRPIHGIAVIVPIEEQPTQQQSIGKEAVECKTPQGALNPKAAEFNPKNWDVTTSSVGSVKFSWVLITM